MTPLPQDPGPDSGAAVPAAGQPRYEDMSDANVPGKRAIRVSNQSHYMDMSGVGSVNDSSAAVAAAAVSPAAAPTMTKESLPVALAKFDSGSLVFNADIERLRGGLGAANKTGSKLSAAQKLLNGHLKKNPADSVENIKGALKGPLGDQELAKLTAKAEKALGEDDAKVFLASKGDKGISKFDSVLAAMTNEEHRAKLLAGEYNDIPTKEYLFALKIEEQTRHVIAAKPVDEEPAKKTEEEIKARDIEEKEKAGGTPRLITNFMKAVDEEGWVEADDKASFKNRIEVTRLADGTEGIGVRCDDQKSLKAAFTQLAKQGCTSFEMQLHDRKQLTSEHYVHKMKAMADGLSDSKAEMSGKKVSITKDGKKGGGVELQAKMSAKTFIMLAKVADKIRENKGGFGSDANSSLRNVISIVNKNMTDAGIDGELNIEDLDSSVECLEKYHDVLFPKEQALGSGDDLSPKEYKTVPEAVEGTGPQLANYSEFNVTASNSDNAQTYLDGVQGKLDASGNSASDITVNFKGPNGTDQGTFTLTKGGAAQKLTEEDKAKINKNNPTSAAPAPPAPGAAPAPSLEDALVAPGLTSAGEEVAIKVTAAEARDKADGGLDRPASTNSGLSQEQGPSPGGPK